MTKGPVWGTSRESVAAWCALPIAWTGSKPGYRKPPRLTEGDAVRICQAAGLYEPDDDDDLSGAAVDLDSALLDLQDARDSGNREAITDARDNAEGCLEEFYGELRKILHPDQIAAEAAEREKILAEPLPGLD